MLATSSFPSSSPTFLPVIPSPLSPRRRMSSNSNSNAYRNARFAPQYQSQSSTQPDHNHSQFQPPMSDAFNTSSNTPPTPPSSTIFSPTPALTTPATSAATAATSPLPSTYQTPPTPTPNPSHRDQSAGRRTNPFAHRAANQKQPPQTHRSQPLLRQQRRNLFLSRIRQDREDQRWGSRIEDLAHLDWRTEKRAWERSLAEEGRVLAAVVADEDEEEVEAEAAREAEAEEALRRENEELEALVEMMEGSGFVPADCVSASAPSPAHGASSSVFGSAQRHHQQQQHQQSWQQKVGSESGFGSDEEEYESIFMDMIDDGAGEQSLQGRQMLCPQQQQQQQHQVAGAHVPTQAQAEDEEMDLS